MASRTLRPYLITLMYDVHCCHHLLLMTLANTGRSQTQSSDQDSTGYYIPPICSPTHIITRRSIAESHVRISSSAIPILQRVQSTKHCCWSMLSRMTRTSITSMPLRLYRPPSLSRLLPEGLTCSRTIRTYSPDCSLMAQVTPLRESRTPRRCLYGSDSDTCLRCE